MNQIDRPVVKTVDGQLRGISERTIYGKTYVAFKGIPYAKPPIGLLRFKESQPAESWSGVKDASMFGPICTQYVHRERKIEGSEDCLYLNVYTRSLDAGVSSAAKPVMVFIHGGAFTYGSGNDSVYGPDYIIENGVVLVTINYRLGIFGFLNLEDGNTTGNQGLKDQVLALKWVQKNISNFGGDPKNVTIFGEGAGGASVHYLALFPPAKGLFHKAISQSGVAINPGAGVGNSPKVYAHKLALALGEDIADPKLLFQYLQCFDAGRLVEADRKISQEIHPSNFHCFSPTVDATSTHPFLPVSAKIAFQEGVGIPFMIGHTNLEGMIFLNGLTDKELDSYNSCFEKAFNPRAIEYLNDRDVKLSDLKDKYFGNKPVSAETRKNYMQMLSDVEFVSGSHQVAAVQAIKSSPTYYYNFSYDNGKSPNKVNVGLDMRGACHADDLQFLFHSKVQASKGVLPPELDSPDYLVMKRVTQMWTNFAKTGNPTPAVTETLPVTWQPVKNSEALECLVIGEDLRMETVPNVANEWQKKSAGKV